MTDAELREIHAHSSYHRDDLERSDKVGCFCCEAIFPAANVWNWTDQKSDDSPGQTAICPLCHVDAVLPDALVPLTPELLAAMNRFWFDRPGPPGP